MGNCKSKTIDDGGAFGHEVLDENPNEYYFRKIEKRNKVQTRDTTIPPPDAIRRRKKRLLPCLNAAGNDGSGTTEAVVVDSSTTMIGTASSVGINQSVSGGGGGIPPVRRSPSSSGVRHRAAMLEQAEQEAIIANGSGRPMASSGIGYGKQRISLTISPTASGGGGATTVPPSLPADERVEMARGASGPVGGHGRVGSGGCIGSSSSSPQRIPASRRDTNRAISASMSVASSTYSAGNEADELMLFEGSTTSAAANYITGRDRDFIRDYVNSANAGGDESDCGSRSTDLSANTKSTLFGDDALSGAMVYTEIGRGGKVSAVAWRVVDTSTVNDCRMRKEPEPVLAVGTDDGLVAIVNAEQNQFNITDSESSVRPQSGCRELPPREGRIRSMSWSPTSHDHLAIGGDDCCAAIVDVSTLEVLAELEREDRVYSVRYSPNGDVVAVGGFDGMVAIACADTLELLAEIPRLPGLVLDLSWNPNGTTLAIGGTDKRAAVVDCDGGDDGSGDDDDGDPWTVVGEIQRSGTVRCVKWDPSGTYLAVGGDDGMVAVVDIANRKVLRDVPLRSSIGGDAERRPLAILPQDYAGGGQGSAGADGCSVSDVTWSPDGAFLAIGGSNGMVAIVETSSYAVVQEVKRTAAVTCVDWQEKYLAVGGEDRSVAVLKTSGMTGAALEEHGTTSNGMEHAPTPPSEENQHYVSATNTSTSGGDSSIEESLTPNEWVLSEDFADVDGDQGYEMTGY